MTGCEQNAIVTCFGVSNQPTSSPDLKWSGGHFCESSGIGARQLYRIWCQVAFHYSQITRFPGKTGSSVLLLKVVMPNIDAGPRVCVLSGQSSRVNELDPSNSPVFPCPWSTVLTGTGGLPTIIRQDLAYDAVKPTIHSHAVAARQNKMHRLKSTTTLWIGERQRAFCLPEWLSWLLVSDYFLVPVDTTPNRSFQMTLMCINQVCLVVHVCYNLT